MGYAYDAQGKQIALTYEEKTHVAGIQFQSLAPGESKKWAFGMAFEDPHAKGPGVTFEAIVTQVVFDDGTSTGTRKWPEQRPKSRGN